MYISHSGSLSLTATPLARTPGGGELPVTLAGASTTATVAATSGSTTRGAPAGDPVREGIGVRRASKAGPSRARRSDDTVDPRRRCQAVNVIPGLPGAASELRWDQYWYLDEVAQMARSMRADDVVITARYTASAAGLRCPLTLSAGAIVAGRARALAAGELVRTYLVDGGIDPHIIAMRPWMTAEDEEVCVEISGRRPPPSELTVTPYGAGDPAVASSTPASLAAALVLTNIREGRARRGRDEEAAADTPIDVEGNSLMPGLPPPRLPTPGEGLPPYARRA